MCRCRRSLLGELDRAKKFGLKLADGQYLAVGAGAHAGRGRSGIGLNGYCGRAAIRVCQAMPPKAWDRTAVGIIH